MVGIALKGKDVLLAQGKQKKIHLKAKNKEILQQRK
jgi:hypothetical protein